VNLGRSSLLTVCLFLAGSAVAQAPKTLHFAPDRSFHLINVTTYFDIDAKNKRASASVVDRISMLRDGVREIRFDTSADAVESVELDGRPVNFSVAGGIHISIPPSRAGETHTVRSHVSGKFFHWFSPTKDEPEMSGFYTEGLSAAPVAWAAQNDFSTTELHITLPKEWGAFSNGLELSDQPTGSERHTVVWKMDQPHAGYLNSIVVGPFDVIHDSWHGVPLIMSCPKGLGGKLASTFEHTKDILSYFSERLGVPYAWTKYGQNLTYDHPYGEENVSATMYPVYWGGGPFLTTDRDAWHPTEWVIAHETAHQWFGDLVTCKDWGDTWLNEGFATFMEMMYTRHSRGRLESLRENEAYSQRFFADSKRDFRPVATDDYSDSTGMGGWTSYLKGATVLMSLKNQLGEENFFRGIHNYLVKRRGGNAESNDLCEDMTDATGINLHPWFDQWIYKPGHPIIDWSWSYDSAKSSVSVRVKQTQDTARGIPIYDVPTHVGVITSSGLQRVPIHLNAQDQTFEIALSAPPVSVLFDPDHDFLREIPSEPWKADEMQAVFRMAPNPTDRAYTMRQLLDGDPSEAAVRMIASELRTDDGLFPAIPDTSRLAALKSPALLDFWRSETLHKNATRRANAATGLAGIAKEPQDLDRLHRLLGDDQPYIVVAAALRGLAPLDFSSIRKVADRFSTQANSLDLRRAALDILAAQKAPGWEDAILTTAAAGHPLLIRSCGVERLTRLPEGDVRVVEAVRSALDSHESMVVSAALNVAIGRNLRQLVPDIQKLKGSQNAGEVAVALRMLGGS
jgi:aminopeptidase N